MHIHRKILFGAAALALPVSALATIGLATNAYAGSKPPPAPPLTATCTVAAGTVTFASPGLSAAGSENTSKTSTTGITGGNITCTGTNGGTGSGSIGGGTLSISTKSTKCKGADNPAGTACSAKGDYAYGSWSAFAGSGVSSITKSLKKLPILIGSTTLTTKLVSVSEDVTTPCYNASKGGDEVGFTINYTVKGPKTDKGQTATVTACLGGTTGPGENTAEKENFYNALKQQVGTTATATIDSSDSTVVIN